MADPFQLRRAGNWAQLLGETFGGKITDKRLRMQLTGSRCLLLDYAADSQRENRLAECAADLSKYPARGMLAKKMRASSTAYTARIELIQTLSSSAADVDAVTAAITKIVLTTAGNWSYVPAQVAQDLAARRVPSGGDPVSGQYREPSFLACLPVEEWKTIFRGLARQHGWLHPGLLLAGETLAAIYGDGRPVDAMARTSVLFALTHETRPFGIVASLRMERLPGGCGVLLPDAWSTAYLQMTRSFSDGLQHAWHAIQQSHPTPCEFDWRWSLNIMPATWHLPERPAVIELNGPSGEAAVACALWAVDARQPQRPAGGDPLDVHVAISAKFKQPMTGLLELDPVSDIDVKTLAGPFTQRRISTVVLAKYHAEFDKPPQNPGEEPGFPEVNTLAEAYQHLARGPRITRIVKEKIFQAATDLRHKLCEKEVANWREDGRRYVRSPLAELLPVKEFGPESRTRESQERRLTPRELKAFRRGRWQSPVAQKAPHAPRIWLHADSGLGKSIQLLICEQAIAASKRNVIPIRLGKIDTHSINLSDIHWKQKAPDVLEQLLDICVLPHVPDDERAHAQEWFLDLVRNGRICFLCDAVDQSNDTLDGMGPFLNSATLARCPVILAGRPEALVSKSAAFSGPHGTVWATLKVLPFGRAEQARFLGTRLAGELIPKDEELRSWERDPNEIRKHGWKDLLEIPFLLKFLKSLAADTGRGSALPDYNNRYEIYGAAIEQLILKGLPTVTDPPRLLRSRVHQWLPKFAFAAVSRHQFSGVVAGKAFLTVAEAMGDTLLDQLIQVDLITGHGVLDSVAAEQIEFRHRSMLEYFAGCRLAELFGSEEAEERRQAQDVLFDVHSVLDGRGEFRKDLLNPDGTFHHLPRDWEWTLRFALSHAPEGAFRDELAWQLIRLGNPWVVFDALERDRLPLGNHVEQVCRWLVHRDYALRDYRVAWPDKSLGPPVSAWAALCGTDAAAALRDLFDPATRDAAVLSPLLELLESTIAAAETDATLATLAAACAAARASYLAEAADGVSDTLRSLRERRQFVPIPAGAIDPRQFKTQDGTPQHDLEKLAAAGIAGPVTIPDGLWMSDVPVTNAEIETWCPTQRRWRGEYSREKDQPAVWVTWFMAAEFARWLTGHNTEDAFTLPKEIEWEYACRAGTVTEYWWGNEMNDELCWYQNTSGGSGPRHREDALKAETEAHLSHPWGLLDMHGNVWEWCLSKYRADDASVSAGRVIRGGGFDSYARNCRAASRADSSPVSRFDFIGLRLVCRCGSRCSES